MYRPYATPASKAQPDVKVPEPRVSKPMISFLKIAGRIYLFLFYGIARIILKDGKDLFEAFKRALEGKSRCIIAFRHPNGGEPQLLAWFFLFRLRSLAKRNGVRLKSQPHAIFVYGYEVARWGGWVPRLIMPLLGALPIHHSKLDRQGMARIYKAIVDGPYPLALAPEGQVSYNVETVPRLEQGTFRMGFNAAERLYSKGSKMPVEVIPVSINFRFGSWGELTLEGLLKKIEKFTGQRGKGSEVLSFSKRVERCREHVIALNEKRYNIPTDISLPFEKRLEAVIAAAMESTERILGVKTEGELFSRMYNLRQICWDRIILPGCDTLNTLSGVERGITDLFAGEAWHASRHLELVDFAWYFTVPLPGDDATLHRKVEYAQNLWDFVSRTIGGAFINRINILPRRVIIHAAPPINLTERLPDYHHDKRAAVEKAMMDLKKAYLDCIDKANQDD